MIKTEPGWDASLLSQANQGVTSIDPERSAATTAPATVRRLTLGDLGWALSRGMQDFGASRTDVVFLCVIYPLLGLLLARLASGHGMLPLVFPLASGFALVGPLAAVGLNEISRRREMGQPVGWADAFGAARSPALASIIVLGLVLVTMFGFWLVIANLVYNLTLGPQPPESLAAFAHDVLYTSAGWKMVFVGTGIGFVFAVVALTISVVSFPMLLDRNQSLESTVRTSVQVVARNPLVMATWGLIIACSLVLGSIPLLLGLVVVMPVLGHATWHLYRRAVSF